MSAVAPRHCPALAVLLTAAVIAAGVVVSRSATRAPLTEDQKVAQALNRLTWGPTPGEVQAVEKIGLRNWINQQLHPDSIAENPELDELLTPLNSLTMTPAQSLAAYPPGQLIQQMALGKRGLPPDPRLRAVVEGEIEALRQRQAARGDGARPGRGGRGGRAADADEPVRMGAPALAALLNPEQIQSLESGPMPDRVGSLETLPDAARDQVIESLPRSAARALLPWAPVGQARQIAYFLTPQQVTTDDLLEAKVLRAVYSNRQLEDVLTDFWFNHFNVDLNKADDRFLIASYERDAIRPHVLGKFSDLLLATARSPAMLFYLDNWESMGADAAARMQQAQRQRLAFAAARGRFLRPPQGEQRGLNENYGRELMELHTLGVNGGYTQTDVIAVARCFTGWTIAKPLQDPQFVYNDSLHDKGEKVLLGATIPAGGGMDDGLRVIQMLSRSPATAQHISLELAQRFLGDDPPPIVVNKMAQTFLATDGDLRQVMETLINAPAFYSPDYFRAQVKSPLYTVVSSVRALGAGVSNPLFLAQQIAAMGEPLYGKQPPTGYDNLGSSWVSSGDLVTRMNFALRLASNRSPGVQLDLSPLAGDNTTVDQAETSAFATLLDGAASPTTRTAIQNALGQMPVSGKAVSPAQLQQIVALTLGSPDFQVH